MKLVERFPKGQRVLNANGTRRGTVIRRRCVDGIWQIMVLFDGLTRLIACAPSMLRRLRRKGVIARMVDAIVKHDPSPEYVVSNYYDAAGHRPYRLVLRHPFLDTPVGKDDALMTAMTIADVHDGDEIRIVVVKTGKRPFGDRRVVLRAPHIYERETEEQRKTREAAPAGVTRACGCCDGERKGLS